MGEAAYIAASPVLLGLRWLRMELSLSVAIIYDCMSIRLTDDGVDVEERKKMERGCGEERDKITNIKPRFTVRAILRQSGSLCVPKESFIPRINPCQWARENLLYLTLKEFYYINSTQSRSITMDSCLLSDQFFFPC